MLRPYQTSLIEQLRIKIRNGERRIIAVLPTGAGKTFTFTSMVRSAWERNRKCLILTDRIELLKQAGGAMRAFDLHPIEVRAGSKPYLGGNLYTAMVETLHRRLGKKDYQYWLSKMDVVIVDECHMRSFDKLFAHLNPNTRVLGFTATPRRMGSKHLLSEHYGDICVGVDIPELIEGGYLAHPRYFGVEADLKGVRTVRGDYDANEVAARFSERKTYRGVVENYLSHTPGTKALVFSSNISSSLEVRDEFLARNIEAKHLDSTMSGSERTSALKWFHETPNGVLCNVGILTKGFDEPSVRTVILYRATKSLPLYLQMCGRGSRVTPSKDAFNILDFGNNIVTHGFWHDRRDWSLRETPESRERKLGEAVLKNCDSCEAFIPARAIICEHCGHVHEREKKEQEFAKLQLLSPGELRNKAISGTIEEMADMAKKKLVKPHYLFHNLKSFDEVKGLVIEMGYSPWWLQYNHDRFWWSSEYLKEVESGITPVKLLADVG